MATGLETFLESIARLPGMAFLERFANKARSARHAVRSGKERAEEIHQRTKEVKDSAGNVKGGKNKAAAAPKAGATDKATTKNLRSQRRQAATGSPDSPAAPKSRRRPGAPSLDPDPRGPVRDTSPERDGGRSLRKRKDDI